MRERRAAECRAESCRPSRWSRRRCAGSVHHAERERDHDQRDRPARAQRVPDLQHDERGEPQHERRHVRAAAGCARCAPASPRGRRAGPARPSSSGSWLTAITMPAPILKPVSTVSEMKCTMPPQRIAAREQRGQPDEERGGGRELGVARGIARGHAAERHRERQRDRRRGADRELPAGAEQRVGDAGEQVAVKARSAPACRRAARRRSSSGPRTRRACCRPARRRARRGGRRPAATASAAGAAAAGASAGRRTRRRRAKSRQPGC